MSLIEKEYVTLGELEERWSLLRRDLAYLAENALLRLSVRVVDVVIERLYPGQSEVGLSAGDLPRSLHSGLVDLFDRDIPKLFRKGAPKIREFRDDAGFARLVKPTPALRIELGSIVVRSEERDRFEAERRVRGADPMHSTEPTIIFAPDGRSVRIGGDVVHLGPAQAEVIRLLREAAASGMPWRDGKSLLRDAGATTMRLSDLFKRRPEWRQLIESDRRGRYRLIEA